MTWIRPENVQVQQQNIFQMMDDVVGLVVVVVFPLSPFLGLLTCDGEGQHYATIIHYPGRDIVEYGHLLF